MRGTRTARRRRNPPALAANFPPPSPCHRPSHTPCCSAVVTTSQPGATPAQPAASAAAAAVAQAAGALLRASEGLEATLHRATGHSPPSVLALLCLPSPAQPSPPPAPPPSPVRWCSRHRVSAQLSDSPSSLSPPPAAPATPAQPSAQPATQPHHRARPPAAATWQLRQQCANHDVVHLCWRPRRRGRVYNLRQCQQHGRGGGSQRRHRRLRHVYQQGGDSGLRDALQRDIVQRLRRRRHRHVSRLR